MPTCLPDQDPNPKRRFRRLERRRQQFTYNYAHVAPLAIADRVPDSHAPAWAWWELVLDRADTILENITEIQARNAPPTSSSKPLARTAAGRRRAAIAQVRKEFVGGLVRETLRPDGADDPDDNDGRKRLGARLGEVFETPWQKILSDVSDQVAIGAIDGRPTKPADFEGLFLRVPFAGERDGVLDDEEFAWMRLAGPNPMVIRRATELPASFKVTEAHLQAAVRDPADTLAEALSDGRLYVCDYTAIGALEPGRFPMPKVVCGPLALFAVERAGRRRLLPVAIQTDPRGAGPVVGPHDGWAWKAAKLAVQAADGNHHEAVSHLGRTHLFVEPFVVATERQLDQNHPIYRLLRPHFEGTLWINNAAHTSLIADGGTVDRLMSGSIEASRGAAVAGLRAIPFDASVPVDELSARGVRDARKLPDYPYRDDALVLWDAIAGWVRDYVDLYYADDDAIARDPELRAWAAELVERDGGRVTGFGEPDGEIRTRRYLIRALTLIIFTASAQHAAVNFPQYTIMSNAGHYPLALYAQPPRAPGTEAAFVAMLPPLEQGLVQLNLGYLLGNIHYTRLGQYRANWFEDPRVGKPLQEFQASLRKVGDTIEHRNRARRRRYPYLHPERVPQSINI